MKTMKLGELVAACCPHTHPLHNTALQKYIVREYGVGPASEVLASASGQIAFTRRRHLLAFLSRQ